MAKEVFYTKLILPASYNSDLILYVYYYLSAFVLNSIITNVINSTENIF